MPSSSQLHCRKDSRGRHQFCCGWTENRATGMVSPLPRLLTSTQTFTVSFLDSLQCNLRRLAGKTIPCFTSDPKRNGPFREDLFNFERIIWSDLYREMRGN